MEITFVREETNFEALSGVWNDLLAVSATDVPFLRYEYQRVWWSTLGGGEWKEGDLWIGIGRNSAGDLRGIAPFFRTQTRDQQNGLMLLGCIEISDYLDFIAPAEEIPGFIEALFQALEQEGPQGWEVIDLYNIPEDSPSLPALETAAARRGWNFSRSRLEPCPVIRLDQGWEEYLQRLDKKQRSELKRKMRRASRHPGGAQWQLTGPDDDLEAATERFLTLMANDQRKINFLSDAMRTQFYQTILSAGKHGWLNLSFLYLGGEPAAGYLCFDYRGRLWVYNSGLNTAFLSLSPGWVLLGHLIQWSIEQGLEEFDFLRGDEAYKYQLGGVERYINRVVLDRT